MYAFCLHGDGGDDCEMMMVICNKQQIKQTAQQRPSSS
jgi:hypothetical protein